MARLPSSEHQVFAIVGKNTMLISMMRDDVAHPAERRTAGRVCVPSGSSFCHLVLEDGTQLRVPSIDVSELGVLVEVPPAGVKVWPALKAVLSLQLNLSQPAEITLELQCLAEVVWMGGEARRGERHYRAGLRFARLSTEQLRQLRRWLTAALP